MPVAKIHVHEGAFKDGELAAIGTAVQAALEEVLSVPPEDYFRITYILPKEQFVHTPVCVPKIRFGVDAAGGRRKLASPWPICSS
jgi:hypothetical protein